MLQTVYAGNFTQLNAEIQKADDVNLTSDYEYIDGDDVLEINRSVKINGYGHGITASNHKFQFVF